jgi:hypothetical protein
MAQTYFLGCLLLLAASSADAGCWVIENLRVLAPMSTINMPLKTMVSREKCLW